jgi:hypothetical protein
MEEGSINFKDWDYKTVCWKSFEESYLEENRKLFN